MKNEKTSYSAATGTVSYTHNMRSVSAFGSRPKTQDNALREVLELFWFSLPPL